MQDSPESRLVQSLLRVEQTIWSHLRRYFGLLFERIVICCALISYSTSRMNWRNDV